MELVGRQYVDFTNDKGEKVEGLKLHYLCEDDRVSGRCAATQFFNKTSSLYKKAEVLPFGPFNLVYGPRGRVVDVFEVPAGE